MIKKQKSYKKWTLLVLIITVAALVVCAANLNLKRSIETAGTAALTSRPTESFNDYYSSNEALSQGSETPAGENERNGSAPGSVSKTGKETTSHSKEKPASYLVTVYEGKIGVFENGDKSAPPFLTADVNVYLLPKEDLALLKKGIVAENFSAVKGILEDYQ